MNRTWSTVPRLFRSSPLTWVCAANKISEDAEVGIVFDSIRDQPWTMARDGTQEFPDDSLIL